MFKSCEISHLIRLARFCIIYLPNAPLHALKISAKATRKVSNTFSCYFFAFHMHAYCLLPRFDIFWWNFPGHFPTTYLYIFSFNLIDFYKRIVLQLKKSFTSDSGLRGIGIDSIFLTERQSNKWKCWMHWKIKLRWKSESNWITKSDKVHRQ